MSEFEKTPWEEQSQNQGYEFRPERIEEPEKRVMSVGEWVITLILVAIPCVNLVMLCIWAFNGENDNRKNYARAALIMMAVGIVFSIFMSATFFAMMAGIASSIY